ncbi:MarR family transcriptional regulator [Flavobacteriaceae bacterium]|nr:MarR family transcriptional regulator [Flavobacteriaceae bacterium]MDA8849555.1 MarR family transcriptional regulator [Flavobacteriaceae bacterium]MDC1392844.1 MarR family transcriptional regulator [Flavobacteriaceae bacterium]
MNSKNAIISILQTSAFISDVLLKGLKPHDISEQQFNVLRILRGQKGIAANLSTVQERMVHKMSNTTRLIDKLIQKKLVKRNVCIENRRKIELFITEDGLDFLKKIDPITDEIEKKILSNISSKDLNSLISILNSIN